MPPPSRLEAAVRNLAAAGRHRELIGFVERWSAYDDPSAMARLYEAESFLALAQVDRAWIRVQDLANDSDASTETLALAARVLLARGWPKKARAYLTRALSDAPDEREVQSLWDQAAAPPHEPEPPPESLLKNADDPATATRLVDLAKTHAARGRTVVARGILERVVQAHPDHRTAVDLLWALDGDATEETRTLTDLTDAYAPVQLLLGDFVDENTESITQETLRSELDVGDESGGHQFPSLFRSGDTQRGSQPTDEPTDEIADVRHDSGPKPLRSTAADAPPSDGGFDSDADTRIVRVRGRDGQPENLHLDFDTPAAGGFDLEAYRREMGVSGPPSFDPALEDEDDDLVVLVGRETPPPARAPSETDPTQSQIGREVAHLIGGRSPQPRTASPDPVPPPPPSRRDRAMERTPARDAPSPHRADAGVVPEPEAPPRRPLWPWLIVLAVTGLVALGTVGMFVVTLALR